MPAVQESQKVPRWVERMREAGYDVRIGTDTSPLLPEPDAMFPAAPSMDQSVALLILEK